MFLYVPASKEILIFLCKRHIFAESEGFRAVSWATRSAEAAGPSASVCVVHLAPSLENESDSTALLAKHDAPASAYFLSRPKDGLHGSCPSFSRQPRALTSVPAGQSWHSPDHADIHTLFRAIWLPRSALRLDFQSRRRHLFVINPPLRLLFCEHAEK